MKDLTILFKDMFNDEKITTERAASYGLDHVARITANNPANVFDTIITNTNTKLVNVLSLLEQKGASIGDRKGSTTTKNQARNAFTLFIRQQEGTIRGKFGETSQAYIRFFPNGLNAFNSATDLGYQLLVDNIIARATQYVADLGVPFKDTATALGEAYKDAEEDQTTEKGDVSSTSDALVEARKILNEQLTVNALTIALQFPLQPEKVTVYFDTSLLFPQKRKRVYRGEPAAGATVVVAKVDYDAGKKVRMRNRGAAELRFQLFLQGNAVGDAFDVLPGKQLEKRMDEFFSNADELRVTNMGAVVGKYTVNIIA